MKDYSGACIECEHRYEENGYMQCGCSESHMAEAPFLSTDDGCEHTTDESFKEVQV